MDTSRTILGKEQYNWLVNRLRDKSTTWKIIGNQVPFGTLYQPDFKGNAGKYMDGWDGYPVERKRLIHTIITEKLQNIVWVTGDYHVSFALENDLNATSDPDDNASVEFVVTSITSANDDEGWTRNDAIGGQADYLKFNPHMKYVNNVDPGYLIVKVEKGKVTSEFFYADTIRTISDQQVKDRSYSVKKGKPVLIRNN
jgi:alkaline phosphatase D